MKLKNLALIGIGYWGKIHLKYLKKNKNVSVKKIFYNKNKQVLNDNSLKKFNLTNNIKKILTDDKIKFVDIVTPVHTHANLTLKFLKKNKTVLVEKPLLMTKKQETSIVNLQNKNNNLVVSYPYIFSKSLNYAKKIIETNKLGKLLYIETNIQQCGRFMKYGVNHLLAPHAISAMSIFFDLKKINFLPKKIISNNNNCETSLIICKKNNKFVGLIKLSLNYASTHNNKIFTFYCDKGLIVCDLNNNKNTLLSYTYKRIKRKNFSIAKVKIDKKKFFDEKNNMKLVINNFFSTKKNSKNFELTKKINNFLKNE